ncbi:uncharacterized protein LOC124459173 [Xenia sp. Carnegie-2017]|uniref:uncharacterized protein LOC124459173 n=1 Tax=Xenia sp. Carnegie-2017 TaxID=2897299 RepID=UPI001F041D0C|nr:uncharacterized protein LOC124459173 [Xenia sp. Carnegie-2017]
MRGKQGEPVAIETVLGWVVSGPVGSTDKNQPATAQVNFCSANKTCINVENFWDLESLGIKDKVSDVHESVINDLSFDGTRYSVGLPWREGHDPLPTNYDLSLKRMKGQIRRLGKNPELLKEYDTIIKAQEELGIIERVGKDSVINSHAKIHYMPHQAVVRKDAKTTKVRVVYDASAKVLKSSVSLNDCLHIGPSLNPLLFDILLRFREQRIALIADIEKAFLNIEVHERDRDSLRKTAKSFYVDDLASGESSTERAYQLYRKANERMNEGGFKLRKWRTNDSALRSQIEEDVRDVESSCVDEQTYAKTTLAQVQGQFGKVLGLEWDSVGCESGKHGTDEEKCVESVSFGVDWDITLPKSVKEKWEKWWRDLKEVKSVSIGRYSSGVTDTSGSESKQRYFLHGFGDASKRAYYAVVYLVVLNGNDVRVKLIASKTRVAPMKELSIPRLELMAARILAHLMSAVRKALESEYNFEGVKYWTDSMTVLYWIVNSGNWKQFVQHRVDEILRLSSKQSGVIVQDRLGWGSPRHYPMVKEIVPTVDSKVEEKRSFVVNLIISARSLFGIGNVISISKYSTLTRLLRVTAWVKRFVYNLKQKRLGLEIFTGPIKASEMNDGECEWIKSAQLELREQPEFKQLERQYGLIEMNGILHCTGRLGESDLEAEAREPIVLPRRQYFTELVIRQCHESVMHGGVRSTLAQLRSKYWVPKGRQEVKRVSGGCVACKRWNSKPCTQIKQAALPEFRVRRAAPFENSGVDFAGPLYVKQRRFFARFGTPKLIVSDNAKTFKAAKKTLRDLFQCEEVDNCLSAKNIEWRFNLERAPWWGGFFERMIGLVKVCLRKVLGNAKLTFDELTTVLAEVEAKLNSRPLTYEYEEVNSEVLTPAHLVYGRRIVTLPDSKDSKINDLGQDSTRTNTRTRFKHLSTILEHFWSRWKREYLTNLREFHKGKKRGEWKTGVIQELICGKDKVVRGARVCVMTNGRRQVLNRAIQHLYPVEVKDESKVEGLLRRIWLADVRRRLRERRLWTPGGRLAMLDS